MEFDNESLLRILDDLHTKVPQKTPEALNKMADILVSKLIVSAPYDGSSRHKDKHLKEVIRKSKVKKTKDGDGRYITIFAYPRGVKGAVKGPRAKRNWDADKNVFKLVVAEKGSSKQPAKPFWKPTIRNSEGLCLDAAVKEYREAIASCGR